MFQEITLQVPTKQTKMKTAAARDWIHGNSNGAQSSLQYDNVSAVISKRQPVLCVFLKQDITHTLTRFSRLRRVSEMQ